MVSTAHKFKVILLTLKVFVAIRLCYEVVNQTTRVFNSSALKGVSATLIKKNHDSNVC